MTFTMVDQTVPNKSTAPYWQVTAGLGQDIARCLSTPGKRSIRATVRNHGVFGERLVIICTGPQTRYNVWFTRP